MTRTPVRGAHRLLAGIAVSLAILALAPAAAQAHATLTASDPADGATLATSPATITATFAEAFDTTRSSMELLGPDGASLATKAAATSATAESMTISGFGTLAGGPYTVRWTTITPGDNGIERGTFFFTIGNATAPSAPPAGNGTTSGGVGDVALPLVGLVVLVAVGLAWFVRRSR